jgi:ubiquinone/menaquinone biosynthesis C-methylase UbiE
MTKNIRLLQAQRISDNKYLQGKEIDRNSKIHTINQLTDIIDSPQLTLLDVGCGTGINAKKLKKKGL